MQYKKSFPSYEHDISNHARQIRLVQVISKSQRFFNSTKKEQLIFFSFCSFNNLTDKTSTIWLLRMRNNKIMSSKIACISCFNEGSFIKSWRAVIYSWENRGVSDNFDPLTESESHHLHHTHKKS